MKKIRTLLFSFFVAIGLIAAPLATVTIAAADTDPVSQIQQGVSGVGGGSNGSQDDLKGYIKTIVNVMLFLLGAIAVIMIIIGGIRYATSNGDSSQISSAKDTVLYAVIGLIVAILAYAIVNFVIDAFKK